MWDSYVVSRKWLSAITYSQLGLDMQETDTVETAVHM